MIALVCLILIRTYSLNFGGDLLSGSFQDRYNVGLVTVGGFILVSLPLLISYLWSPAGTYQPFLEIIYNTVGFILFITVGALALDHYRNWGGWTDRTAPHYNATYRGDLTQEDRYDQDYYRDRDHSGYNKFFGMNVTDNAAAGKALGVRTQFFIQFKCVRCLITDYVLTTIFTGSLHHQRLLLLDRCCPCPPTRIDCLKTEPQFLKITPLPFPLLKKKDL